MSPFAVVNFSQIWALANILLFLLPFIVGTMMLNLFSHIINVTNTNDLAIGLPLIAFYTSVYTILMGMFKLLQFKLAVCLFYVHSTFLQSESLQIPPNSAVI